MRPPRPPRGPPLSPSARAAPVLPQPAQPSALPAPHRDARRREARHVLAAVADRLAVARGPGHGGDGFPGGRQQAVAIAPLLVGGARGLEAAATGQRAPAR